MNNACNVNLTKSGNVESPITGDLE